MWKQIKNFDYEIDEYGIIRRISTKQIKTSFKRKDGYIQVQLNKDNKRFMFQVHILVALCYVDNPDNYPIVMHKDNNKGNNFYENLKWGTYQQNAIQKFEDGLQDTRGSKNPYSKLNEQDVLQIRQLSLTGNTTKQLSEQFKVAKGTIKYIVAKKTWTHV